MEINVGQIFVAAVVSLLVGAVSAWIAGTLGVRHGLKRAQREKAFDRRLEWYEKAFRLIDKFRCASADFLLASAPDIDQEQEELTLIKTLETGLKLLDECFEEAIMFAERAIVIELNAFRTEVFDLQIAARDAKRSSGTENARRIEKAWKVHATMDKLLLKIGASVRGQLNLDSITAEDLKSAVANIK